MQVNLCRHAVNQQCREKFGQECFWKQMLSANPPHCICMDSTKQIYLPDCAVETLKWRATAPRLIVSFGALGCSPVLSLKDRSLPITCVFCKSDRRGGAQCWTRKADGAQGWGCVVWLSRQRQRTVNSSRSSKIQLGRKEKKGKETIINGCNEKRERAELSR